MICIEGSKVRLRAVEPADIDAMYAWENDPAVWRLSGTTAPFSRHTLERFLEEQQYDIFATRQLRLIIEPTDTNTPVGAIDLYEFDPLNGRAGVGILIHDPAERGKGYAAAALKIVSGYAREVLYLHQLWCGVGAGNAESLALFGAAGFRETGIRRDWNRTQEGYEDEIVLQKTLGGGLSD